MNAITLLNQYMSVIGLATLVTAFGILFRISILARNANKDEIAAEIKKHEAELAIKENDLNALRNESAMKLSHKELVIEILNRKLESITSEDAVEAFNNQLADVNKTNKEIIEINNSLQSELDDANKSFWLLLKGKMVYFTNTDISLMNKLQYSFEFLYRNPNLTGIQIVYAQSNKADIGLDENEWKILVKTGIYKITNHQIYELSDEGKTIYNHYRKYRDKSLI
jgi:hypothetical protein